jgi:choline dehydrogenase-like flavoprotein
VALGYQVETLPRNVRGCAECGPCVYGCPHGAKQDALVTYLQDAVDAGAQVLVHCAAERIVARGGAVVGVEATAADGDRRHRVEIRCRTVVLAGGALFSPALLLRSGLGNSMVGRGLRLHPVTAGLGVYERPIGIWAGRPQTAVCTEFARVAGTHGFSIEAAPAHPGLAALAFPWRNGADHKNLMTRYAHAAAFIVLVRDHGSGRVRVTPRGDPLVHYGLHPEDRSLMLRGLAEMGRIHLAAGAQEVFSLQTRRVQVRRDTPDAAGRFARDTQAVGIRPNALSMFSAHLMGSLPMGADPRRAAVDPAGQLYGVRGLYISDASVFPSAPGVNPMITVMAMAHRTAQRVGAP